MPPKLDWDLLVFVSILMMDTVDPKIQIGYNFRKIGCVQNSPSHVYLANPLSLCAKHEGRYDLIY